MLTSLLAISPDILASLANSLNEAINGSSAAISTPFSVNCSDSVYSYASGDPVNAPNLLDKWLYDSNTASLLVVLVSLFQNFSGTFSGRVIASATA